MSKFFSNYHGLITLVYAESDGIWWTIK